MKNIRQMIIQSLSAMILGILVASPAKADGEYPIQEWTDLHGQRWSYISDENGTTKIAAIMTMDYDSIPASGAVVVPDSIKGYEVIAIRENAFKYCSQLTSIVIPECVSSIQSNAFYKCVNLVEAILPDRLGSVKDYCFFGCKSLQSVNMPTNLGIVGVAAFQGCSGLKGPLWLPDGTSTIYDNAFNGCSGLTYVSLPNRATIRNRAFSLCDSLESFEVRNVSSYGTLTAIDGVLYTSVEWLNRFSLTCCPGGKKSITIPATANYIDADAFYQNVNLESISVASGNPNFKSVGGVLYSRDGTKLILCPAKVATVQILTDVTQIADSAFYACQNLTEITIPENVRSIGTLAFVHCTNLRRFNASEKNQAFKSKDGLLITKDGTKLVAVPGRAESISIPSGVSVIGSKSSFANENLQQVDFNVGLKDIGVQAFAYCSGISSITMPEGVTNISNWAFNYCTSLKSVTIPSSVKQIGVGAYEGCVSLTTLVLKDGVKSIGAMAFAECTSLETVAIPWSVTSIDASAFVNCEKLRKVELPEALRGKIDVDDVFAGCAANLAITYSAAVDPDKIRIDVADFYVTATDGSFQLDIGSLIESSYPPNISVKGLPAGLSYVARTRTIGGQATKPGEYMVTVSVTNSKVKKPVVATFSLTVPNLTSALFAASGLKSDENYFLQAGVPPAIGDVLAAVTNGGWKIAVSGLPPGLKYDAKANLITGVASKEGVYTVYFTATRNKDKQIATATFEVVFPTLTLQTAALGDEKAGGKVTGGGKYPYGKKVTLKATPDKGSVLAGWREGNAHYLSQEASYAYVTTTEDVTLTVVFATAEEDIASLKVTVADDTTAADGTYSLALGPCIKSVSVPKLVVSGLPSGLKYDAKTLTVTGKATKPGVYTVKVSATNASVKKATQASTGEFRLVVPNFECAALPNLLPATNAYGIVRVGTMFDTALVDCTPADGWTVKISGLPSGLKWDAKNGVITGVPTAKAGSYTVTFTASKKGEKNQVATVTLNVEALPDWAVGTFEGTACERHTLTHEFDPVILGLSSISVAANGKISGKLLEGDKTWTLSAPSFETVESPAVPDDELEFRALIVGRSGKMTFTNELFISCASDTVTFGENEPSIRGQGVLEGDTYNAGMWQKLWKKEPWKTGAKPFARSKPLEIDAEKHGTITIKFDAGGMAKATGKFVTDTDQNGKSVFYSATCSSTLMPVADSASCYSLDLYFPPKSGKFDGYAVKIQLVWDGSSFSLTE